mgnify:FL=1
MSYSREKIVKQAQAWIGLKESDGSHMEIINVYNNHKPLARGYKVKSTDSWCATFVSAVSIKCGYTAIIPTECSCPQMIQLFKNLGEWVESDSYKPSAGDIILYDWGDSGSGDNTGTPDHIGIVEKVSGNTITVIEGNKNDSVSRRTLQVNGRYIRGYGVPKYDGTSSSNSTSKPSTGGSSTSSNGKAVNYKVKINTPSGVNIRSGAGTRYSKVSAIPNGKILTNKKKSGDWGYTTYGGKKGWISLNYTKKVTSSSSSSASGSKATYKVGTTYKLQVDALTVRTGAGTNYKAKTYSQLTANAKQHAYSNGCLKKGTAVTCQKTKTVGSDIFILLLNQIHHFFFHLLHHHM